jgi:CelD/BcsL family acetyltransferase involved in cellulose biosynthesis
MTTSWSVTRLQRSLGELRIAWDALNQRLYNGHPLLAARFVDCLLKHFGTGDEHLCMGSTAGGLPIAMCILRRGKPGVWTTFLPSQAQLGPTLLTDAALLPALLRALPGLVVQIDLLCNDPHFGGLASADGGLARGSDHALTMNVSLAGNFETYWHSRPKQLRKNLRRYQKRLADDGIVARYVMVADPVEVQAATERYAELEGQGWKGRQGTALGSYPAQLAFYRELLKAHAADGTAYVFELWLGDRLAASRLLVGGGNMIVILKTTYDESQQAYAPGRQLLHELIRNAFALWSGQSLEFYTNANVDQLAWSSGQRSIRHITTYRNWLTRATGDILRVALRPRAVPQPHAPEASPVRPSIHESA